MKQQKSWVSHCIVPCPGINRCEYYKPGEVNHPLQHTVSKVMHEDETTSQATWRKKIVLTGTFLNNLTSVPFNPKLDPPVPTACFNCWRTNHFLRDCYLEKWYIFCRNCGRRGVEVEDCPRCKKAYCEYVEEEEHIRAKIELYGDESSADYYERRKDLESKKSGICSQSSSVGNKKGFWSGGSFDKDSKKSLTTDAKPAGLVTSSGKGASLSKVNKFSEDFWNGGSFDKDSKTTFAADRKSAGITFSSGKGASLPKDKYNYKEDFQDSGSHQNIYLCDKHKKEHESTLTGIVKDFNSMNLAVQGANKQDTFSSNGHMNLDIKNKDEQEKSSSNGYMNLNVKKKSEGDTSFSSCHKVEGKREEGYKKCSEANLTTSTKTNTIDADSTNCKSLEKREDDQKAFDASSLSSQLDDDEDYDDMIVDEDEKSVISYDSGDAAQRFTDLLQSIKNMPIEAQEVAVRCFVNAQKRQNQM